MLKACIKSYFVLSSREWCTCCIYRNDRHKNTTEAEFSLCPFSCLPSPHSHDQLPTGLSISQTNIDLVHWDLPSVEIPKPAVV